MSEIERGMIMNDKHTIEDTLLHPYVIDDEESEEEEK